MSKPRGRLGCLATLWLIAVAILLLTGGILFIITSIEGAKTEKQVQEFQEKFASLDVNAAPAEGASKIIGYDQDSDQFSLSYIPAELEAQESGEVALVLFYRSYNTLYGTYSNGAGAYVRHMEFSLYDMESRSYVDKKVISGSNPPNFISSDKNANYGDYPDTSGIMEWVRDCYNSR